jgi:peptidoglycan hydrolase FlgJ
VTRLDLVFRDLATAARAAPKLQQLKKAATDFEAVLLKDMLGAMRRATPNVSHGESMGSHIYRDMLDQTLADTAAQQGTIGLGRQLFERMSPRVIEQERAALQKLLDPARNATPTGNDQT